jgi:hypothetical protein
LGNHIDSIPANGNIDQFKGRAISPNLLLSTTMGGGNYGGQPLGIGNGNYNIYNNKSGASQTSEYKPSFKSLDHPDSSSGANGSKMALKTNIMEEFTQSRRAGMGSFGAGIMNNSAL